MAEQTLPPPGEVLEPSLPGQLPRYHVHTGDTERVFHSVVDTVRADHERHEDIFVEMLVHYFIFEDDHKTYFRNYLANYSFDPIAYYQDDGDSLRCFMEVLFRGFFITDPYRLLDSNETFYQPRKDSRLSQEDIDKAFVRFKDSLEDAGPFFYEWRRLCKGRKKDQVEKYMQVMFEVVYRESYWPVCCIWNDVQNIYQGVCCNISETEGVFGTHPDGGEIH